MKITELEKYDLRIIGRGEEKFFRQGSFAVVAKDDGIVIQMRSVFFDPFKIKDYHTIQICQPVEIDELSITRDWYCYTCEASTSHTKRALHENKISDFWVCSVCARTLVCSRTLNEEDITCQELLNKTAETRIRELYKDYAQTASEPLNRAVPVALTTNEYDELGHEASRMNMSRGELLRAVMLNFLDS